MEVHGFLSFELHELAHHQPSAESDVRCQFSIPSMVEKRALGEFYPVVTFTGLLCFVVSVSSQL